MVIVLSYLVQTASYGSDGLSFTFPLEHLHSIILCGFENATKPAHYFATCWKTIDSFVGKHMKCYTAVLFDRAIWPLIPDSAWKKSTPYFTQDVDFIACIIVAIHCTNRICSLKERECLVCFKISITTKKKTRSNMSQIWLLSDRSKCYRPVISSSTGHEGRSVWSMNWSHFISKQRLFLVAASCNSNSRITSMTWQSQTCSLPSDEIRYTNALFDW